MTDFEDLPLFAQSETQLQASLENVAKALKKPAPLPPIVQEAARIMSLHAHGLPLPCAIIPTAKTIRPGETYWVPEGMKLPSPDQTSAEAASKIAPSIGSLEAKVLDSIKAAGNSGACCFELEHWLGMAHTTCSARITGLKKKGKIIPSGQTRETPSGCKAIAWRAVDP